MRTPNGPPTRCSTSTIASNSACRSAGRSALSVIRLILGTRVYRRPMTGRLAGKVAIVTGAGSRGEGIGNGKAASVLFAREGASVLCADQIAARAAETVEMVVAEGGTASTFECDVSHADGCRQ